MSAETEETTPGLRVDRRAVLHTGAHDGSLVADERDGLPLHVGAHERAGCVVVLEERNERRGNGDHLPWGHVHVLHIGGMNLVHVAVLDAHEDALLGQAAGLIDVGVGLRDGVTVLLVRGEVVDLIGDDALNDLAVRGVRQTGERVVLIHELRQLRGAEELLERSRHGTDVDQGLRGDGLDVLGGHAVTHDALHAAEAGAELILDEFAHRAETAVAEVVDVVGLDGEVAQHLAVLVQGHDVADRGGDVVDREDLLVERQVEAELLVDLVPT